MFLANDTSNPLKYKKIGIKKNGHSKNKFERMLWFFFNSSQTS